MAMTREEKIAWLASQGKTQENRKVVRLDADGNETVRSYTDEEWDDYIDSHDWDKQKEVEETREAYTEAWAARQWAYPRVNEQVDAIFHGLKTLRDGGLDVGTTCSDWIDKVQAVKDDNPLGEKFESSE